jgi:hypothetical protein
LIVIFAPAFAGRGLSKKQKIIFSKEQAVRFASLGRKNTFHIASRRFATSAFVGGSPSDCFCICFSSPNRSASLGLFTFKSFGLFAIRHKS